MILVGTYRRENADWIKRQRIYNLPLAEGADAERYARFDHIVLFNGADKPMAYSAAYIGIVDSARLADCGYSLSKTPHGRAYAAFMLTEEEDADQILSDADADVCVCSTRFTGKIDADFYLRTMPQTGGKSIPNIFARLRPYAARWHGAYSANPIQMDFLDKLQELDNARIAEKVREAVSETHAQGKLACVEICAGAGGQALGLDRAGFEHVALVEYEREYCDVLLKNKPHWNVICGDIRKFDGRPYEGVDLLAGGVPCPPFSVASRQLGKDDERDLFPEAIRLIDEIRPKAVMIENVRGLLDPKFDEYRTSILTAIGNLGYNTQIKLLQASDYGVPQIRPRVVIVGIRNDIHRAFSYPDKRQGAAPTVGDSLRGLMGANGWAGADDWAARANRIAPTIVGGSKKHGGPDLGPTRARRQWAEIGVDGLGIANAAPARDFVGMPRLTKEMMATIQGFPETWDFGKKKTAACRMIGNAFPPPVAQAVGEKIKECLQNE